MNTWTTSALPMRRGRGVLGIAEYHTKYLNRWSILIGISNPTPISNFQPTIFDVAYILMKPIKYGGRGYDDSDLQKKIENLQQQINEVSAELEHMNN